MPKEEFPSEVGERAPSNEFPWDYWRQSVRIRGKT